MEGEEKPARSHRSTVNIIDDIIASKRCVPPFPRAVGKRIWEAAAVGLPGKGELVGNCVSITQKEAQTVGDRLTPS